METLLNAFRLALRVVKVPTVEEGLKDILIFPSAIIEKQVGTWEYQILAQTVLLLRRQGLPEHAQSNRFLFQSITHALKSCKEPTDDDPIRTGGPRPAA